MPLKLNLGSVGTATLATTGDLAKRLMPGIDSLARFSPQTLNLMGTRVADLPAGSLSADFNFNVGPSWQVSQAVGITLSVQPGAACSLAIVKPGGELFRFNVGDDETPVNAPPGRFYIGLAFQCSLALDVGATWSSGNFGVSGDVAADARFRVANCCQVPESATLGDALVQAFSNFVLPFQADRAAAMPDGNFVDVTFLGKLGLGFGATYGFSGLFLAGRSNGEVSASFNSPIGKSVASIRPAFQVGAAFKLRYEHIGAFRVIAGRVNDGAQDGAVLYLLRQDAGRLSTSETLGITLSAGANFEIDPATLNGEIQKAAGGAMAGVAAGNAGATLGSRLGAGAESLVGAVNAGAKALLARGDGQKIALELLQSQSKENTALFIYRFDFKTGGLAAYDTALRGDYASAVAMPGVALDPRSFVEQLYVQSAGLNIQLFDLLRFHSVEDYIQRTDVAYVGGRTFQVRDTVGVKAVSGLFGKERHADLYFVAESSVTEAARSGLKVRLHAVFQEQGNPDASAETSRMLVALGQPAAQPPKVILDADAAGFGALPPGGQPAYEGFVRAVADVIGATNTVVELFLAAFPRFTDWVAFSEAVGGNPTGNVWPDGYPPSDRSTRLLVQTYILAGQHFMDFCVGVKHLATDVPGVTNEDQYQKLLNAISGMVKKDLPFPTYFLKPAMVALMRLAGVTPAILLPAST